jgi:hypothetical protein
VWFEQELKQARAYDSQYAEDDEVEKDTMFQLEEHVSDLRSALQAVADSYASGEQINNSMVSAIFTQYNTAVSFLKNYLNSGRKIPKRERDVIDDKFQELVPLFDQVARLLKHEGDVHNKSVMDNIEAQIKNRQYVSAFQYKRIGIPVDDFGTSRNMGMISPNGIPPTVSPRRILPQTPKEQPHTPPYLTPLAPFDGRKTGIVNAFPNSPKPTGTPRAQSMPAAAARERKQPDFFQPGKSGKGKDAERLEPFQAISSVSVNTARKSNKKTNAGKVQKNDDHEFNGTATRNYMFEEME